MGELPVLPQFGHWLLDFVVSSALFSKAFLLLIVLVIIAHARQLCGKNTNSIIEIALSLSNHSLVLAIINSKAVGAMEITIATSIMNIFSSVLVMLISVFV